MKNFFIILVLSFVTSCASDTYLVSERCYTHYENEHHEHEIHCNTKYKEINKNHCPYMMNKNEKHHRGHHCSRD